jgi:hypothetical protein
MTATIISLAEVRAATQARETMQSLTAEFDAHMQRGGDHAGAFEILTRMWAHRRENPPPPGGSRVGGAGR